MSQDQLDAANRALDFINGKTPKIKIRDIVKDILLVKGLVLQDDDSITNPQGLIYFQLQWIKHSNDYLNFCIKYVHGMTFIPISFDLAEIKVETT